MVVHCRTQLIDLIYIRLTVEQGMAKFTCPSPKVWGLGLGLGFRGLGFRFYRDFRN